MDKSRKILCVSVNWIGDVIMSLPALQAYQRANPQDEITVLAKPSVADLWRCHSAPHAVWTFETSHNGMKQTITQIRAARFDAAYVLPNSFRSAWIPFRGQVSERIGMAGNWRRGLLTEVRKRQHREERCHQVFETYDLLLPQQVNNTWEDPVLNLPEVESEKARQRIEPLRAGSKHIVAFMPGAARGSSKQWHPDGFIQLGHRLVREDNAHILILGAPGERALCANIAASIGANATSVAGETSLLEWMACIKASDVVVANDSGGMHVAAALGRPLVGLYGITDPDMTGPLTEKAVVLQKPGPRHRDVPRVSKAATEALSWIKPAMVYDAITSFLRKK